LVLLEQRPVLIDVADPAADESEVRYLVSIGQRSMAMVPLVAAGRTIGLVEVTSARPAAFDERSVELATMLAGEAAMALENARLYDEIRHQALHDGLTGLANRVSSGIASSTRSSAAGGMAASWQSCSSISTTSRPSTTPTAMPAATRS